MLQFQNINQNKILKLKSLIVFCICFSVSIFGLNKAQAASVFFEPREINTTVDRIEEVEIFLNTSYFESVNAFEISVEYPTEFLKLKDWSDGNSIINLWIKEPRRKYGTFSFQGIIPGGYSEKDGLLMTLYFEGRKEGVAEVKIKDNSQILLNDGRGTQAKTSFSSAVINIKLPEEEMPKEEFPLEFTENISPEPFTPIISRSDEIYGGNYFLIFSTQDKNSGINYYEVSEGEEPFRIAQSPYLLRNQRLDEDIKIRAIDKAGNERIEIVPAKQAKIIEKRKITELELILFAALLLSVIVIFAKYLYNRIRKTKIKNEQK